jgi:acyl phosphate:glycerol-3-phosphate acyltransferase
MPYLIILVSYILGSLPTSYILGRVKTGRDIRRMGDKNAGAANAFRELGSKVGVVTGMIDAVKGSAVILIAQAVSMSQPVVLLAGLAAVIGHNWPIFLRFRGGRGVSTTIGILFVLVTFPMLVLTLPALAILIWRRNVTPAMAFLFIVLPLIDWAFKVEPILIGYGVALPALVGITTFFRTRPKPKAIKQV